MKRILITSLIIFYILVLNIGSNEVSADVGVPPTPGATLTPGDKTDDIEMKSEKVLFDIKEHDSTSPFYIENNNLWDTGTHYAHVTASFTMRNITSTVKNIDLIFPIPADMFLDEENWEEYFDLESKLNTSLNHEITINGVDTVFEYDLYKMSYKPLYNPERSEYYVVSLKFPAVFESNIDTKIVVQYDTQMSAYEKSMYMVFEYVMATGSHWKGNISSGEIIFNFPYDISDSLFYSYNDEFELSGNQLIWTFTDLEPDDTNDIFVRYSPYLVNIWGNRDTYIEDLFSSSNTYYVGHSDVMPSGYKQSWGIIEGNPIYLLTPHPYGEDRFKRWSEGFWLASIEDENPWVQYEFDSTYEIEMMRITSGIKHLQEGTIYQLVSRPKKLKLTFSNGTEREVELEDKPQEEITVNFDKVQTSSIRVEVLESYPDYLGENTIVGIEELDFRKGTNTGSKVVVPDITIPDEFLAEDSNTTRIDQMSLAELEEVENFTLEIVGKNKVVFDGFLNLTSSETLAKLKDFSEYVDFSTTGKIMIDTGNLSVFRAKASITMYGLDFEEKPIIYKDGELATSDTVSSIEYDSDSGVLAFDVDRFSTYEAIDREREIFKDLAINDKNIKINWSMIFYVILIFFITFIGIIIVLIYRRKDIKVLYYKIKSKYFKSKGEGNEQKIKK